MPIEAFLRLSLVNVSSEILQIRFRLECVTSFDYYGRCLLLFFILIICVIETCIHMCCARQF